MPKFPVYTPMEIIRLLQQHGFVEDHQKGSHKLFYHPVSSRRVIVPYHKKDLPIGTTRSIFRMAGIDTPMN